MTDINVVNVTVDDGDNIVQVEVTEEEFGGGGGGGSSSSLLALPARTVAVEAAMLSDQVTPFQPAVYLVSTDPWPFAGYTNFDEGNIYLFTDCQFRCVDFGNDGEHTLAMNLEASASFVKNGLTFIGGSFYGGRDEYPEATSRNVWHDFYCVSIAVPDTTLIGSRFWNVGDAITTARSNDDPIPHAEGDRLRIIGVAMDAPANWQQDLTGCPGAPTDGSIDHRHAYIHDDALQFDNYYNAEVKDVLVNGAYDCISILAAGSGAGLDKRSNLISIEDSLFRSAPVFHVFDEGTHGSWTYGPWFKVDNTVAYAGRRPSLDLKRCVFFSPGDTSLADIFDDAWDLPTPQGSPQYVNAEDCVIIWCGGPFEHRTNWDLYGTNITIHDNLTVAEGLALWNLYADAWRAAHPTLDVGRVAAGAGPGVDLEVGDLTVSGVARFEGSGVGSQAIFTDGLSISEGKFIDMDDDFGSFLGRFGQKIGKWGTTPTLQPSGWVRPTGTLLRTALTDSSSAADVRSVLMALVHDLLNTGEIGPEQ